PSYDLSMDKIENVGRYIRDLKDRPFSIIDERFKQERAKLEASLDGKKATLWPVLGVFADAGRTGNQDDTRAQNSFGLNLTWAIPWKGKDQSEVTAIREQISSVEIKHQLELQKAQQTVREKKLTLLQLYRQIQLLDQQLELGKRQQA